MQMAATALLCTVPQRQETTAAGEPEAGGRQLPAAAAAAAHAAPQVPGAAPAARGIAAYLLTAPRLIEDVPAGVRAQLTSLRAFHALLPALGELRGVAGNCASADPGSPWSGDGLVWSDYLWALVNLTQLVSGVLVTKKLEVRC